MTPLGAAHNVTVKTQVPPPGECSNENLTLYMFCVFTVNYSEWQILLRLVKPSTS